MHKSPGTASSFPSDTTARQYPLIYSFRSVLYEQLLVLDGLRLELYSSHAATTHAQIGYHDWISSVDALRLAFG